MDRRFVPDRRALSHRRSLVIEHRKNLTSRGRAEFFAVTEVIAIGVIGGSVAVTTITIRDFVVRGANPNAGTGADAYRADREAQHGFDIAGVKNSLLERVTVTDVYGDFVYIGRTSTWTSGLTVRNSTFERSGRQGVAITAGEDILIEHNVIRDVRHSTFDIEPNGPDWGARRVTFSDNEIEPAAQLARHHGRAAPVEDIVVIRNRLKGKTMNVDLKAPESHLPIQLLVHRQRDRIPRTRRRARPSRSRDSTASTIRGNVVRLDPRRNIRAQLKSTCGACDRRQSVHRRGEGSDSDAYKGAASSTTSLPTQTLSRRHRASPRPHRRERRTALVSPAANGSSAVTIVPSSGSSPSGASIGPGPTAGTAVQPRVQQHRWCPGTSTGWVGRPAADVSCTDPTMRSGCWPSERSSPPSSSCPCRA